MAQAALNYFDRSLDELSLSEIAYLAALPKAPNRYHIIRNEKEAYVRRDYVLHRMAEDGYITAAEEQAARAEKLQYRRRSATEVAQADFFAEEVRRNLMAAYGEKGLYEGGLTVSTTLDPAIQAATDNALRDGLIAYDRRHGWRGPYAKIPDMSVWEEEFARIVQRRPLAGPSAWQLAVVSKVEAQSIQLAGLPDGGEGTVPFAEMTWARPTLQNQTVGAAPRGPRDVVSVGDVIVVGKGREAWRRQRKALSAQDLCAAPGAQRRGRRRRDGYSGRSCSGHVRWLVLRPQPVQSRRPGRAPAGLGLQAIRLPRGDGCRLHAGLDRARCPVRLRSGYGQPLWTPKNYGGDMLGPTTVRRGLELSRNLMTVRMAQQIGMKRVVEVAKEFGVTDPNGRLSADGAWRRRDDAAPNDHGLCDAGERRARDHAIAGRSRPGPQRQDGLSPRTALLPRLRRHGGRGQACGARTGRCAQTPSMTRRRSIRLSA